MPLNFSLSSVWLYHKRRLQMSYESFITQMIVSCSFFSMSLFIMN